MEELKYDNYQLNCKCGSVLSFVPGGTSGTTTVVLNKNLCSDCIKAVWSCSVCKKIIKLPAIRPSVNATYREKICDDCSSQND